MVGHIRLAHSGLLVDCKIRRTAEGVEWQAPPILPEERVLGYKLFSWNYVDSILNSGYPELCCGIRFSLIPSW